MSVLRECPVGLISLAQVLVSQSNYRRTGLNTCSLGLEYSWEDSFYTRIVTRPVVEVLCFM